MNRVVTVRLVIVARVHCSHQLWEDLRNATKQANASNSRVKRRYLVCVGDQEPV